MNSIYLHPLSSLKQILKANKINQNIAELIFNSIYQKSIKSFKEMTFLSNFQITKLEELFFFDSLTIIQSQTDSEDLTTKFLIKLGDNNFIETVVMKFDYGFSVCITSQVGCNMACKFCASGLIRKKRNLAINEMVLQVLKAIEFVKQQYKQNLSHIVVMGIGEPFDNYDNLIAFLEIVTNQKGLNIASTKITVSTCGLVDKIKAFADLNNRVNLAISLHAPNDSIRNQIMPINKKYPIAQLMDAIKYFIAKTNKRIAIEYILIENVNDSIENAIELAALVKNLYCYLNLIPYNKVIETNYCASTKVNQFFQVLKENKINVTVRIKKGNKIDAACGQLRVKKLREENDAKGIDNQSFNKSK
ncbi:MAG: 23S rRNA (adenine(2503)-C(2))-methyltransferase RlmN [Malacoplasma sp.]|nr:23S rRNA (adenine(2503)-C(2))-methyltransferase RlmN [Malacoplasma sp.]